MGRKVHKGPGVIRCKGLKFLVHSCNPMRRGGSFSIRFGFNILLMLVRYVFVDAERAGEETMLLQWMEVT